MPRSGAPPNGTREALRGHPTRISALRAGGYTHYPFVTRNQVEHQVSFIRDGDRVLPLAEGAIHMEPENRTFFPALDGMRAIAFLAVFMQHYVQLPWGWTGVDFFFVLSGFLITGILFDSRSRTHRVRNFYVRRTLRIFPLYYGIMVLLLLSSPFFRWQWSWDWLLWPSYLGNFARFFHPYAALSPTQRMVDFQPVGLWGTHLITPFLGHFWSLCIEEQFYLFWPWLVFSISDRRKLIWVCIASLPACLTLRLLAQHYLPAWMLDNQVLYRATPFRVDALLLGGLLALWLRGKQADTLLRLARIAFPVVLVLVIAVAVTLTRGHIFHRPYPYPSWMFTWGLMATDLTAALLLLECLQKRTFVYRILSIRPLRWLGRISYGAYVFHDIPHLLYEQVGHYLAPHNKWIAAIAIVIVAFAGTLLLSWLSFVLYESRFLELKERWTFRDPNISTARGEVLQRT